MVLDYVDDCIFQAECSDRLPIFDATFRALACYNLAIQPRKCSAHLPVHADGAGPPCALLPFLAQEWGSAGSIAYDADGVMILGT